MKRFLDVAAGDAKKNDIRPELKMHLESAQNIADILENLSQTESLKGKRT